MVTTNPITQMAFLFVLSTLLSVIVIRLAIDKALAHGIADHPGGHKQHDTITPFVGGVGVFAALAIALVVLFMLYPDQSLKWLSLGLSAIIIFATGFADDILQLNYKVRLIIQAMVAMIMVAAGGVVLSDLGELLPGMTLTLGLLSIPFTVFAAIGGINALNMIDGLDGLAGTVSLRQLQAAWQASCFLTCAMALNGAPRFFWETTAACCWDFFLPGYWSIYRKALIPPSHRSRRSGYSPFRSWIRSASCYAAYHCENLLSRRTTTICIIFCCTQAFASKIPY